MNSNAQFDGSIPVHYDRFLGPILFKPFAVDLAARLETGPEASILELACGTGILTETLRNRLPVSSRLTATDLNQPMLDYARAKLAGVNGITWGLADASNLEFPSDSFDAVLCQFGLMFVPNKASALSEIYRVLRHDGVFLFSVWDAIHTNELARIAHETVAALFPANPPNFYEVPFNLHNQNEQLSGQGEISFQSRFTDTLLKRQGCWQVVARHYSRLPPEHTAVNLDSKVYEAYIGQYEIAPNFVFTVTKEGDKLVSQATGQPKYELLPESQTAFFIKDIPALFIFMRGEKGDVNQLITVQDGRIVSAKRIK